MLIGKTNFRRLVTLTQLTICSLNAEHPLLFGCTTTSGSEYNRVSNLGKIQATASLTDLYILAGKATATAAQGSSASV